MTTLAELTQQVYEVTNRADLVAETRASIVRATLSAHQVDTFWRDCKHQVIDCTSHPDYVYRLDLGTNFPRLRAVSKLHAWCPYTNSPMYELAITQKLGCKGKEFWRIEGSTLTISSPNSSKIFELVYYQNPDMQNYSSWIADLYPYIIVDWAAYLIFEMLGDAQMAAMYANRVGTRGGSRPATGHCMLLIQDNLERVVRGY